MKTGDKQNAHHVTRQAANKDQLPLSAPGFKQSKGIQSLKGKQTDSH